MELLKKIYNKIMQMSSNFLFRGILKTRKFYSDKNSDVIIYCALDNSNCMAYLLAIKSLLRFLPLVKVVVQNDGSLSGECIKRIKNNIINIEIYSKEEMFSTIKKNASPQLLKELPSLEDYENKTPIKILYLKFFNVLLRFYGKKVIIIDSDLLFLRNPKEVREWMSPESSFDFYGEGSNANSKEYYKLGFDFSKVDVANFSSGFIGLKVDFDQHQLTRVLNKINIGNKALFNSWEIEQALWAILFNFKQNKIINLDELRNVYVASGWRSYKDIFNNAILVHFAGAFRFKNFRYLRLAWLVIFELKNKEVKYFE